MTEMKKIELLAPAGDLEKLKTAIRYGADAVYFGGEMFSLRAGAGNLNLEEMKEGLAYAHERGKRCYLTINIYAHNEDIDPLYDYLRQIRDQGQRIGRRRGCGSHLRSAEGNGVPAPQRVRGLLAHAGQPVAIHNLSTRAAGLPGGD